jgi:hypothetical protein
MTTVTPETEKKLRDAMQRLLMGTAKGSAAGTGDTVSHAA